MTKKTHMNVTEELGKVNSYTEGKEVVRVAVIRESMAFHWLSPCQKRREVFLLPVGLCYGSTA